MPGKKLEKKKQNSLWRPRRGELFI